MTRHVHHVFVSGNDVILLELRPLIFVYLYMRTQSLLNIKDKVNILKNTRPSIIRKWSEVPRSTQKWQVFMVGQPGISSIKMN